MNTDLKNPNGTPECPTITAEQLASMGGGSIAYVARCCRMT